MQVQCLSLFESWTAMLWFIDSCQSKVYADQYHVTGLRAQVLSMFRASLALRLSLWRRANARNVSFLTRYGGQFTISTKLINQITHGAWLSFRPTNSLHSRLLESP